MIKKAVYIFIAFTLTVSAQVKDYEVGSKYPVQQRQGGFYDYSDPESINFKVSVWGFVKYPGRYVVPSNTELIDLLSYAGGPTDGADLDDIRIYRKSDSGEEQLFKIDLNDWMWDDEFSARDRNIPALKTGDVIIAAGSPRYYFRDYFSMALQIVSTLITLVLFIINITS